MGGARPSTLAELSEGRVEVVAGSAAVGMLEKARRSVPALTWNERRTATSETLIRRVIRGETDYVIVPSNEFSMLRHYYPEASAAFSVGARANVAWALPAESTELREAVSTYFAEITATGELDRILLRNRQRDEFDFVGSRAFVRHMNNRFPHYQEFFKLAAAETGLDWRYVAAVAYQESHWDPAAVSPTGVRGVMMLTEHTADIVGVGDRSDAWESILGGARYLRRVYDKFPTRIPARDRRWFAAAAYNIGFGHVEDARIITEIQGADPDSWDAVRERLPLLADEAWHSRVRRGYAPGTVPVDYVENVQRYLSLLEWMEGTDLLIEVAQRNRNSRPVSSAVRPDSA